MSMKWVNQIFGCILLIVFLFLGYTVRTTVRYWMEGSVIGPGPGFFPFWICMILSGLTLYWLVQVSIEPGEAIAEDFVPGRHEGMLILLVFVDMVFFCAIINLVGFFVACLIFNLVMVVALGERTVRTMIYYVIFAVGVTYFFDIVFGQWLEVAFPKAEIGILKAMGL
jgi:putative tricarboxylic transport membrane protein